MSRLYARTPRHCEQRRRSVMITTISPNVTPASFAHKPKMNTVKLFTGVMLLIRLLIDIPIVLLAVQDTIEIIIWACVAVKIIVHVACWVLSHGWYEKIMGPSFWITVLNEVVQMFAVCFLAAPFWVKFVLLLSFTFYVTVSLVFLFVALLLGVAATERDEEPQLRAFVNDISEKLWTPDLKDDSCVTCLESFTPVSCVHVYPCGHVFHVTCSFRWLMNHKTCPVCRLNLEPPRPLVEVVEVVVEV